MLGEVLFCESDGRHAIWGASEVLFCELDGWVLRGMQFGVLVEVPRARGACSLVTAGCWGGM